MSGGNMDSRGVAIIFNNNFEFKERADGDGNFLILEIEIAKQYIFTLVNIYGPNQDKPKFYSDLFEDLDNSQNDFTIMCGDWNLVQDESLNYFNYNNINNPKAKQEVLKIKETLKLQDPFSVKNPIHGLLILKH